jgi:electron transport complex protein RnfC
MDVGVVVLNVGSLKSIAEAFKKGQPLVERGLTLSGGACKRPRNLLVPVGTLASDLLDTSTDLEPDFAKLIFGGPMMGTAQARLDIPVQKNSSGILFLRAGEAPAEPEGQCIRCGNCMRVCTCRLSPMLLNSALMAGDLDEAAQIGLMDCVECGTCSYACPARIQLVQRFRVGKQLARARKQKEAANAPK